MGLQKREVQTAAVLRCLPGPAAEVITSITVALQRDTDKIKAFYCPIPFPLACIIKNEVSDNCLSPTD